MADSTDFKKWISRVEQDIKVADIIKNEGVEGLEDSFCYICQQAAEKLLKCYLIFNHESPIKTHDLNYLLKKCTNYDSSLKSFFNEVSILNEYAISARYPNDFEDSRTKEEADEAYENLIKLKSGIEKSISKITEKSIEKTDVKKIKNKDKNRDNELGG